MPSMASNISAMCKLNNNETIPNDEEQIEHQMKQIIEEAKVLVKKFIPRKIKEIDDLLKTDLFNSDFDLSNQKDLLSIPEPLPDKDGEKCECKFGKNCKCPTLFPNGPIESNSQLEALFAAMVPHLNETLRVLKQIKAGLRLMVPKVEDGGSNAGVAIQEAALQMVIDCGSEIYSNFEIYRHNTLMRGLDVICINNYPHSRDHRLVLKVSDEQKRIEMTDWPRKMKEDLMTIYDFFIKNWSKIVNPLGSSSFETMY